VVIGGRNRQRMMVLKASRARPQCYNPNSVDPASNPLERREASAACGRFPMARPHPKIVLARVLLLSLVLIEVAHGASDPQHRTARKQPPKQTEPAPPPPEAPPPPPPTLQQMPAVPPTVTFTNGLLTIVAENSTLSDILRAVRSRTGATVDVPANATERVVTHLGPGVPRDVITSLLNGSHFNYVMLGSPTNPNQVDKIILTSKSGEAVPVGAAPTPPPQNNVAEVPSDDQEAQPTPDASEQPAEGATEEAPTAETDQPQPNGQPQVKTPEQLLRELQAQQQQQQQQQQQTQPPPQAPPR